MIPALGAMIWAYGVARIFEVITRKGERAPNPFVIVVMVVMVLIMTYSCIEMQAAGEKGLKGLTP